MVTESSEEEWPEYVQYGNHKQQADRLVNANRIKSLKIRSSEQRNRYVLTRNVTDKESQKDRRTQKLRSHGTNPMKPKSPKHDQSTSTDITTDITTA